MSLELRSPFLGVPLKCTTFEASKNRDYGYPRGATRKSSRKGSDHLSCKCARRVDWAFHGNKIKQFCWRNVELLRKQLELQSSRVINTVREPIVRNESLVKFVTPVWEEGLFLFRCSVFFSVISGLCLLVWYGQSKAKEYVEANLLPSVCTLLSDHLQRELDFGKVRRISPLSITLESCSVGPHSEEFSCGEVPAVKLRIRPFASLRRGKIVIDAVLSSPSLLVAQKKNCTWLGIPYSEGIPQRHLSAEEGIDYRTRTRRVAREEAMVRWDRERDHAAKVSAENGYIISECESVLPEDDSFKEHMAVPTRTRLGTLNTFPYTDEKLQWRDHHCMDAGAEYDLKHADLERSFGAKVSSLETSIWSRIMPGYMRHKFKRKANVRDLSAIDIASKKRLLECSASAACLFFEGQSLGKSGNRTSDSVDFESHKIDSSMRDDAGSSYSVTQFEEDKRIMSQDLKVECSVGDRQVEVVDDILTNKDFLEVDNQLKTDFVSRAILEIPCRNKMDSTRDSFLSMVRISRFTNSRDTLSSLKQMKNAERDISDTQEADASSSSSLTSVESSSSLSFLEKCEPLSSKLGLSSAFTNFAEAWSVLLVNPWQRLKSEIGKEFEHISTEIVDEIRQENTSGVEKMIPVVLDSVHFKGGTLMLLAYGDTEPREMEVASGHVKFQNHYGRVHVQLSGNCKMWRSDLMSEDGGWLSTDVYVDIIEQKWHANLKIANLFVPLFERILDLPISWSKGRASGEVHICMSKGETFPNLHGQLDVTGLAFNIYDAPSSFSMLERYFPKKRKGESSSSPSEPTVKSLGNQSQIETEFDINEIIADPGLRKPIEEFRVGIRDQVRREYLTRGPCQLVGHLYPKKKYGIQERSFQDPWYKRFSWLEYSVSKDAAFCFWCYLFKKSDKGGRYGEDAFTKIGCSNWKNALEKFNYHVGDANSCHNNARIQFESFKDQRHNVPNLFQSNGRESEVAYRVRLTASLDVTRFLLKQGLPFRGHDESTSSSNRGNFLELILWFSQHSDVVSKALGQHAPANNQMNCPRIQKQLVHACASEVTLAIVHDIGDKIFTILVDEARDVSLKEQMGVVLRYVNAKGCVVERFLGIVHVAETSSHCLKLAIDALFVKYGLSLSKLRGQGYDGASNMRGEFNGLKSLILQENPYAMYIHCFSHQLQLIIIVVAKSIRVVKDFFSYVSMIVNTTGASCKRKDQLRELQHEKLIEQLDSGKVASGRGQNQEIGLARPGDTRWGSHYITLLRLCSLWTSVEKVLENVRDDATSSDNRSTAEGLIERMDNYEFVFMLHLMKYLLGITNELSVALQHKDQNIVQAMSLIKSVKSRLQTFRNDGWEIIFDQTSRFCELHNISPLDMEDIVPRRGQKRYGAELITNLHHYRVEIFYQVVDLTIQEMDNRFSEVSTDLLRCIACLDPKDTFSQFDVDQVMRLAALYHEDFSTNDCLHLPQHLASYIVNVRSDPQFCALSNLGSLAEKMVETGKHSVFPLVYRIIELALVLPVATASVERAFSAMKIIKTDLRNRMEDEWMNDSLVVYIEKELFSTIDNEKILQRFQSMESRRYQLAPL